MRRISNIFNDKFTSTMYMGSNNMYICIYQLYYHVTVSFIISFVLYRSHVWLMALNDGDW